MTFGTTSEDNVGIPTSSVYTPGTANSDLTTMEGGPRSQDGNSQWSAPASMWVKSGNFADFGQQNDAAATTDTGTFSFVALFKRALQKLTSLVTNTSAFVDSQASGTVQNDNDSVSIVLPGGQATVIVSITGTIVGTLSFQGSPDNGTTWYSVVGSKLGTPATLASSASGASGWRLNISGFNKFQVLLHPVTSGSGTVLIRVSAGGHNVVVNNAQAVGQSTSNNSTSVAIASDQVVPVSQNGVAWTTAPAYNELDGLTAVGAASQVGTTPSAADLVPATDISAWAMWSLHITTISAGATLVFQGCNDGLTWLNIGALNPGSSGAGVQNTSIAGIYFAPRTYRWLRVRQTVAGSGTPTTAAILGLFSTYTGNWSTTSNVNLAASVAGGTADFHLISAAGTNITGIKGSQGQVYSYEIFNAAASVRFVKLFNKFSPALGTDIPYRTIGIAPGVSARIFFATGLLFTTSIALATTTGIADLDTGGVGVGDLSIDIDWK